MSGASSGVTGVGPGPKTGQRDILHLTVDF